ncbi:hypothetical protein NKH77_18965 [Streptomyces sp. M19]
MAPTPSATQPSAGSRSTCRRTTQDGDLAATAVLLIAELAANAARTAGYAAARPASTAACT